MTTYTAHVRAHPDCLAQSPEDMAVEAALAVGWTLQPRPTITASKYPGGSEPCWTDASGAFTYAPYDWRPYTDPVHATELLAFTALGPAYISVRVYPVEFADGMRWYAEFESEVGCREEQIVRDTFPAASTTACLLALRQYWRV